MLCQGPRKKESVRTQGSPWGDGHDGDSSAAGAGRDLHLVTY